MHCLPCDGKLPKLISPEINEYLKAMPAEWHISLHGNHIYRYFMFKNFSVAISFIKNVVARIAEEENHHPDIHLTEYKKVLIELTTHSVKGLTQNDFILAAKIEKEYEKLSMPLSCSL